MTQQDDTAAASHPLDRFLYKKIFGCKELGHFRTQYVDDVCAEGFEPMHAVETHTATDETGTVHVYVMPGGVAVARFESTDGEDKRWAAYETKERAERQAHLSRWADFARGEWTRRCPDEAGVYPVVALSAAIPAETPFAVLTSWHTRKLERVSGVVRDVTTHCPSTVRTEWQGWWWSEALPLMQAPTREGES